MKLLIDVGYTKTRMAEWLNGQLSNVETIATYNAWMDIEADADQRKSKFVDWLSGHILARIKATQNIDEVGICLPGAINNFGAVANINSLWGRASEGLEGNYFSNRIGIPVFLYNDLVAAAAFHGPDCLQGVDGCAVILNIGSGIGSKLYDPRRGGVVVGRSGLDGEIGLSVVDDGPSAFSMRDGTSKGALGLYSSGSGFARLVREAAAQSPTDARVLGRFLGKEKLSLECASRDEINRAAVNAIASDDQFLLKLLERSINLLANVLHIVVLFNSPNVVVITGGFYHALERDYRPLLCSALSRRLATFYSLTDIEAMVRSGRNEGSESLLGIAELLKARASNTEKLSYALS